MKLSPNGAIVVKGNNRSGVIFKITAKAHKVSALGCHKTKCKAFSISKIHATGHALIPQLL